MPVTLVNGEVTLAAKLAFQPSEDPEGNGQETAQLVYKGTVIPNVFVCVHGGGPENLRVVIANAPDGTAPAFEVFDGHVSVLV